MGGHQDSRAVGADLANDAFDGLGQPRGRARRSVRRATAVVDASPRRAPAPVAGVRRPTAVARYRRRDGPDQPVRAPAACVAVLPGATARVAQAPARCCAVPNCAAAPDAGRPWRFQRPAGRRHASRWRRRRAIAGRPERATARFLPAPLGPMITVIPSASISRLTPQRTARPPGVKWMLESLIGNKVAGSLAFSAGNARVDAIDDDRDVSDLGPFEHEAQRIPVHEARHPPLDALGPRPNRSFARSRSVRRAGASHLAMASPGGIGGRSLVQLIGPVGQLIEALADEVDGGRRFGQADHRARPDVAVGQRMHRHVEAVVGGVGRLGANVVVECRRRARRGRPPSSRSPAPGQHADAARAADDRSVRAVEFGNLGDRRRQPGRVAP